MLAVRREHDGSRLVGTGGILRQAGGDYGFARGRNICSRFRERISILIGNHVFGSVGICICICICIWGATGLTLRTVRCFVAGRSVGSTFLGQAIGAGAEMKGATEFGSVQINEQNAVIFSQRNGRHMPTRRQCYIGGLRVGRLKHQRISARTALAAGLALIG